MRLSTHFNKAINNLLTAKLRTLLAVLGILVGTASVVALLSAGKLATETALDQFKSLGLDVMSITLSGNEESTRQGGIKIDTYDELANTLPEILAVSPYVTLSMPGSLGVHSWDNATIVGATDKIGRIMNIKIKSGRFISDLDEKQNFCVVGNALLEKMKVLSPLGGHIRVGKTILTVIGVAEHMPVNSMISFDINQSLIVPLETGLELMAGKASINNALIQLKPDIELEEMKPKITAFFEERFPGKQVFIQSAAEIVQGIQAQQGIFTVLLGFIGSISLIVGGIGVINIMLASVAERKYEIGLRLALGAQPRDIRWMFLMEAAVLGILGGLLGVILGLLSTLIIANFAGWEFELFLFPPALGFSISLLVTLCAGFYPALIASKVNPIDALRGN